MLETVEHVCAVAFVVVLVLLVVDRLDEHRWVEVDKRAFDATHAVIGQVHRRKGTVGAVALAHHGNAPPATAVGIEPIGLLARRAVGGANQVRGIHSVPLSARIPREDGTLVAPLREVFDRCRPHAHVVAAILVVVHVVGAYDVGTLMSGIIGVVEYARLTVGKMFPKRQIRILGIHCHRGGERKEECCCSFYHG